MWMNEYIAGRSLEKEESSLGEIRSTYEGRVGVASTRDYKRLPLVAPAGIAYVPAPGLQTVVVQSSGGAVCAGVITAPIEELEEGELMLYSAGGASIVLKNDGKVLINGREAT